MRLFTGLALPPAIADQVAALSLALRTAAETARLKLSWTPIEKLHITTKFIGEFSEDRLSELREALATITMPSPIDIRFGELDWMPHTRHPSALYATVESTTPLCALASATDIALDPLGIERENRLYRPHVTLARLRGRNQVSRHEFQSILAKNRPKGIGYFRATCFFLYLSSSGKYTKLNEFNILRE